MIFTLMIGLALALLFGIIAQKLSLSPLVGYLFAGIAAAALGTGGMDGETVHGFSDLGIVLLLFGVGLQFHFKDLLAVRQVAVPGSIINMVLRTLLAGAIFYALTGCSWECAAMFGACLSVSSTVVLTRVLEDNRILQTPVGHTALGWLVVEDIATIVLLVLLPALVRGGSLWEAMFWMAVKLLALIFCVAYLGKYVIKKVLTYLSGSASGELFTLAVLVFAIGIAGLSAHVFGASMEFGAFLSGMVLGQSRFAARAASEALPMRDAFAVLFFVSVGMGFNLQGLLDHWQLALAILGFTMLLKPIIAYLSIRLLRKPFRLGVLVSGSFSQIGEFSFILASLAASKYDLLPDYACNVITGVAIISITLNAMLYRLVPPMVDKLERRGVGVVVDPSAAPAPPTDDRYRIIVVGYGPCGELLTRILRAHDMDVLVLEMNINTVTRLAKEGIPALHGDARVRSILRMAGCEQAKAIIISTSAAPAEAIASAARGLNPEIRVVAQTQYIRNARLMEQGGAAAVFSGEEEVALSMNDHLLRGFGATEEQVMLEHREAKKLLRAVPCK